MRKVIRIPLMLCIWGIVAAIGFIWGVFFEGFSNPLVPLAYVLIMIFAFLRISKIR